MRELSLHVLDLIENSIRAGASVVHVTVAADRRADVLRLAVEDNGPGFAVPQEQLLDPFYTTKRGKKVGLGLSLLDAACGAAGGSMKLQRGQLGGAMVDAVMKLKHVDRAPLGDLASTISSVVCTNPELDLRVDIRLGTRTFQMRVRDEAGEIPCDSRGCKHLVLARRVMDRIRAQLGPAAQRYQAPATTRRTQERPQRTRETR